MNETNLNEESGQFVHVKELFVRTDSFANELSLVSLELLRAGFVS